jgi:hypothetical protein
MSGQLMDSIKRTAAEDVATPAPGAPTKRRVRGTMSTARKEQLRQAYAAAAADPAFLAEMAEIDRAFDVTVGDGLTQD